MTPDTPIYTALCEALDDEYKARATYGAAISAFGPVTPFINIIQSEDRHVEALLRLFASRGWTAPADPYWGKVTIPGTFEEACRVAIQAEIDNVALYDRLNRLAAGDAEILSVFGNLQWASQERHLPAFQRGATGGRAGTSKQCCGGGGHGHHGREAHHGHGRCCGA